MDYLRVFSKIIPEEVISPRLDHVLEEVTAKEKLFRDSVNAQEIYRSP